MCFTSTVGYGVTVQAHYLICTKNLLVRCLYETISDLFANSSCKFILFYVTFSFELKRNTIQILWW